MANYIKIAGMKFNRNFFYSYMRSIFGESFAHSSLSFEKIFADGKKYEQLLNNFISEENTRYATLLENGSQANLALLKQRYAEIAYALKRYGVPEERTQINETDFTPCISDFTNYFKGAVRPYRNTAEYKQAEANGELKGEDYESETVLERVQLLFQLITEKVKADTTAFELKKGNNDAFAYALAKKVIGVPEIIKINSQVNNEAGIHEGFKTSNNDIFNAPFTPCPKELVPIRMQELLHKYNNEWAQEIPQFIEGVSTPEEKNAHLLAICEREAKFHIEFERIHPFEDGNGRTGRIVLNANLVRNELAPILITPEMHSMYINAIDSNDYKSLGQYIFMLSSVCLTEMVSYYRKVKGINPDEQRFSPQTKSTKKYVLPKKENKPSSPDDDSDVKIYAIKNIRKKN